MVELDKWVPTNRASLRSAVRLLRRYATPVQDVFTLGVVSHGHLQISPRVLVSDTHISALRRDV